MIYTRCPNCHKRISIQDKCDCRKIDKAKVKNGNAQLHDNYYKTSDWLIARDKTISSCHGLDIYSLLIDHKIEYGQTVHHIIPLEEDYTKRDDINNLIYITETHHRQFHKLYKSSKKKEVQDLLLKLKSDYDEFVRGVGKNVITKYSQTADPNNLTQDSQ